jgi:glycerate kinase
MILSRDTVRTILIAPDSFKGSLTAREAAGAIAAGVRDVVPAATFLLHPVSDGGEGLVDILTPALHGEERVAEVTGPLAGQRVKARWGYCPDSGTAIIEMAQAAGLWLVPESLRDPKATTTFGVGELIRTALDAGAQSFVIGIGGSATNDGGAGMAQALGARFLDAAGASLGPGGAALQSLAVVDVSGLDRRLRGTRFTVACDVHNPLTGPAGASQIYGPQKGASASEVELLDDALQRYRNILLQQLGVDVQSIPGSGAAGGLGAGLSIFCGARLERGIDVVLDATGFEESLRRSDLVITGEGRLDAQLRFGKALAGVLDRARVAGKPVVAVVGMIEGERAEYLGEGAFVDLISLVDVSTTPERAILEARELVQMRSAQLMTRLLG